MRPSIYHARTEDGVSIAYWTLGSGPPLIAEVGQWSHVQKEWDIPERRAWFERSAESFTLIRFDHRGTGLSDRNVTDVSLEAFSLDVDAVLDRLGIDRAPLFGTSTGHRNAVHYAATRPERISHLVLWHPFALIGDVPPTFEALYALRDADWEFYTDAVVLWVQGWTAGEASARIGAMFREALTPEIARAISEAQRGDHSPLFEKLTMPTLLIFRPGARNYDEEMARSTAAMMPHARSAFLDGTTYAWYIPDSDQLVSMIEAFIEETSDEPAQRPRTAASTPDTRTILFTDMQSSAALTRQLGDVAAQEVRRTHNDIVRSALSESGGSEIKHTGDGIMASFTTASSALDCAIAIQRGVATFRSERPDSPLAVYVGLNAGEPIAEEQDLFGTSVDLAKRICDHAEPGQILASNVVRELAAGKRFLFSDLGDRALRGFEDPVKLWEVRWRDEAP